ncbi:hypothetical protein [Streptomyces sp. NPDC051776]|uniref:hypothetical protein n=1 Tax=Streptomyces sp. NPDC051776 TaxID=3155414 RepID=UPI00342BDA79
MASTVYQRDDIVVRLMDCRAPLDSAASSILGVSGPLKAPVLGRLIETSGCGELRTEREITRFIAHADMRMITDRPAPATTPAPAS